MKALSGIDASFLYLETPNMPMHVGGVAVYEGTLTFEAFRETLTSRLHLIPKLRQRLVQVPLSLDRPYWLDDPDFHLDWHLHHTALPDPGGWQQLRQLASRLFAQPLDRSRPLWEMIFVEGLNEIPLLAETAKATLKAGYLTRIEGVHLPPMPFTAPRTRFNAPVSKRRIWNSALLSLDRVKAVRHTVEGAPVNDVILAICAGALRRYLDEKEELPAKPLVAMLPVSTRTKSEKNKMGNKVSAMLVRLATGEADPVERFKQIVAHTHAGAARFYRRRQLDFAHAHFP